MAALHHLGGEGPLLVLIHGFGADRLGWAATAPAFFATHAVWAVELPAHGAADPGAETPATIAAEVADALADLPGPRALVGHSLGGAVAAHVAAARPDEVSDLVLIAPGGLGADLDAGFLTGFADLRTPEAALAHLRRLVVRDRLITPAMAAHVLAHLDLPGRRAALAAQARALIAAPPPPLPHMARVIWGAEDRVNPPDPVFLAGLGTRALVLPGTGHLPQVEAAGRVNRALAGWLGQAPEAPAPPPRQ